LIARVALQRKHSIRARSFSNIDRFITDDTFNNVTPVIANHVGKNLLQLEKHPLHTLKSLIFNYFEQTFKDSEQKFTMLDDLDPVVSSKQCFDELLIPTDHVSRRPSDTFYISKDTCLRTHTSAHQTELIRQGKRAFLVAGDVFRRDEIDQSHYPVFHQMEGVYIFPNKDISMVQVESALKSTLEGMVRVIFGDVKMRWVDAYFPFTEPSLELEIWFNDEWLEVLGCGVVHQDIMGNCNMGEYKAWAFGLGLERLAMVLFQIPDIRLFWTNDSRFHDQFKEGTITTFKPYSKYPPVLKDISFWIPEEFHVNDFYATVREISEDLIERVDRLDVFTHPKTNRESHCYRITFRSMDRSLTNVEIDKIQALIRSQVVEKLDVELR